MLTLYDLSQHLTYDDAEMVERAYYLSETAHKDQKRVDGSPYFQHSLNVAYTFTPYSLLQESYDRLHNLLVAGVMHDVLEDTDMFGLRTSYAFREVARRTLERLFTPRIAELILAVTRTTHNGTKEDRDYWEAEYHARLSQADEDVRLLKLADILDNAESAKLLPKDHKLYLKTQENIEAYLRTLGTPRSINEQYLYKRIESVHML